MEICIIGHGQFGLAISHLFSKSTDIVNITCIGRNKTETDHLQTTRTSSNHFNKHRFSEKITFKTKIDNLIKYKVIVFCIPSNTIVEYIHSNSSAFRLNPLILVTSKGCFQNPTTLLYDDIKSVFITHQITSNIFFISGPTFAIDIIQQDKIFASIAYEDKKYINDLPILLTKNPYHFKFTDDIIGVQLLGTLKNIYAIGGGILNGLDCSTSIISGFITLAISELKLIVQHFGGNQETVCSFCGIGDLVLSMNSKKSRNYLFGFELSKGKSTQVILNEIKSTVEGLNTIKQFYPRISESNLQIPFVRKIIHIVNNGTPEEILVC